MEPNSNPPIVFDYLNSRDYLRDFLHWGKEHRQGFTHRTLLEKMEVSSTGFIANVLSGKSNLNARQTTALTEIFRLNPSEARFFQTLVAYTQARSIEEKGDALDSLRTQVRGRYKKLDPRQYSLFSKWLYPIVFDLVTVMRVGDNHKEIADLFDAAVKPDDVRKALEVLESLLLLRKTAKGVYEQVHASMKTGDEITSTDVVKFQQATLKKAMEALDHIPAMERSISVTTIPLSAEGLERVKQEARNFRDRVLKISEEDRAYDRVYQLNLNLFPATKSIRKGVK
ncbi:MAG: hypothetical protein JWO30_1265 [Fibrobacteres bacterium]|nr:hypothetical protein [Fibrobacterota bacterium]